MNDRISNEEIADHVEGLSDRAASRRVLRAALTDRSVRDRLSALEDHENQYWRTGAAASGRIGDAPPDESRARRLRAAMRNTVLAIAAETTPASPRQSASPEQTWGRQAIRVLQIGRQLLALPCLAPITASGTSDNHIHRQTVQTGDGVRIEFQQLPGSAPFHLRVLIDAAQIQQDPQFTAKYNIAYLTLEDGGSNEGATTPPDLHLLIIPLNDELRGFADFVVGSHAGKPGFPAPSGACRLVSATLSHDVKEQRQSV